MLSLKTARSSEYNAAPLVVATMSSGLELTNVLLSLLYKADELPFAVFLSPSKFLAIVQGNCRAPVKNLIISGSTFSKNY